MNEQDETRRKDEVTRGLQAQSVLDAPIWAESYEAVVNQKLSRLLAPECGDEETLECKRQILALHAIKRKLETEMQTGMLAAKQLEESKRGK